MILLLATTLCVYTSSYTGVPPMANKLYHETQSMSSPDWYEFEAMVISVIQAESGGDPLAVSPAGAEGLMQLTSGAIVDAARFCSVPVLGNPFDPEWNITYGSCYLHHLYQQTGNWKDTLIIYNGGYKGLKYYNRTGKLFNETKNYLERITRVCK